eukprot:gnl/Trimastix_PCT/332.p1 GENE.gnl/Trimastix_PCT/332~~gnl/Trimastix_PCT/332.p1  ORF type:complete len:600 (+),score=267.84 gnl/Trimastix_PCT/332:231-2030(+)
MRKIKTTQQTYHDKISQILDDFPRLDDVHPFYSDLLNILYDRDHYKLALAQINVARHLIDKISRDYVLLLKHGESLYQCKRLKKAALGRMCTVVKRIASRFDYLEQVRQHLSRLPSIDPTTRSLIVCGYPNVGKTSFVNTVTRANLEVEPYAFTTKSLLIGHMDYKYMRWQVMDTPGILDHPLEERNTIEMQSVTALAHLTAAILYFVDISEQCGFSLEKQVSLFHSIKPLFAGKPLIVVLSKADVMSVDQLPEEKRALLDQLQRDLPPNTRVDVLSMSSKTGDGVAEVKETSCDRLLEIREVVKTQSKKMETILNRLHVAMPAARDEKERSVCIPESVLRRRAGMELEDAEGEVVTGKDGLPRRMTEKDRYEAEGREYAPNLTRNYLLADPEWKDDPIPEIMDGANIADWVDPDVEAHLEALEAEEDRLLEELAAREAAGEFDPIHLDIEYHTKPADRIVRSRDVTQIATNQRKRARSVAAKERRTTRTRMDDDAGMNIETTTTVRGRSEKRSQSRARARSASRPARDASRTRDPMANAQPGEGFHNTEEKKKARKQMKRQQKHLSKLGRVESDRRIMEKKPKHLFVGKRGQGKTDRR